MRMLFRGALVTAVLTVSVLFLSVPAQAHARLVRSDPANGVSLPQAPTQARLWFSEPVSPRLSSVQVADGRGRSVTGTTVLPPSGDRTLLAVSMPALPTGTYSVVWRVLADDGHITTGLVVFSVGLAAPAGTGAGAGGDGQETTDTSFVALRWLSLCLLAGVVGGLGVAGPVLAAASGIRPVTRSGPVADGVRRGRRRILRLVAATSGAAACVGIAELVLHGRTSAGLAGRPFAPTVLTLLTTSRWGALWLAGEAALVVLAVIAVMLRRRVGQPHTGIDRATVAVAAMLVAVIVSVRAAAGHAGSLDSGSGSAVAADGVHVLTALFWLGALPALVLVIWPRGRRRDSGELVRAVRAPFTHYLVVSATLLVATGLYSAGRQVGPPADLVATPYGRTLLVKSALLLLLGGLGLVNSARLHGWWRRWPAARPASRRLVLVEAAVGAVLLIAAGTLAETAPPRVPLPPAVAAEPAAVSTTVADLVVTVWVSPGRPGPNVFTVMVTSSRRPPPAPVDSVLLGVGDNVGTWLGQLKPGQFLGTTEVNREGQVQLAIALYRGEQELNTTVGLQLPSTVVEPAAAAPSGRLALYLNTAAVGLVVLAAGAGAVLLSRRRRQRRPVVESAPPAVERILEEV